MNKSIPYGRQHITEEDIRAVTETLQSDFLTQGPAIKQFEDAFAHYVGGKYAVAVANNTAALHLYAIALDQGENNYHLKISSNVLPIGDYTVYLSFASSFLNSFRVDVPADILKISVVDNLTQRAKRRAAKTGHLIK